MCDYSLELYRSRPAVREEQYALHRFPSGTMGFTSARDCETAVCMPADANLRLAGIAESVQRIYAIGPVEDVVMTRMEGGMHVHRDAVRFASGREVLLQSLNAGLTAALIDFPSDIVPLETLRHPTRELVDA